MLYALESIASKIEILPVFPAHVICEESGKWDVKMFEDVKNSAIASIEAATYQHTRLFDFRRETLQAITEVSSTNTEWEHNCFISVGPLSITEIEVFKSLLHKYQS